MVNIHLVAEYVVVIYETAIAVYKNSGEYLQEFGTYRLNPANNANKFKYFKSAVNLNNMGESEIYILANNATNNKNTTQSIVYVLKEKEA